jgi:predicted GIY-YIG superfamily endonuclease
LKSEVEREDGDWYVYIVDKKGNLYVGITTDLLNRMRQHGVVKPVYQEGPLDKSEALKSKRTLKGCRKEKKLALIDKKRGSGISK